MTSFELIGGSVIVGVETGRPPKPTCQTYWGSHGCGKRPGHQFGHRCCCRFYLVHLVHRAFPERFGCVGRHPYYGPTTRFF